jgi:uncharacterized protein YkwD
VFHARALLTLALSVLALTTAPGVAQAACAGADVEPSAANLDAVRAAVLCLHNEDRAADGLPSLREHARLQVAASGHSRNMVAAGFFDHTTPEGRTMTDRIRATGYLRGSRVWTVGENIGWATGALATPREIHAAWMRSAGHRANILRRDFREIGIGIQLGAPARPAPGATYTADFGTRSD